MQKALLAAKIAIGKNGDDPLNKLYGFSIYKTIIILILSYWSVIWAMNSTKSQIAKITTIQTLAKYMIKRCKTSIPKCPLDVMLNMQPLDYIVKTT